MLIVHLNDGKTIKVNGEDPSELAEWLDMASCASFQEKITGITVNNQGVSYSVPKPKDFRQVFMMAEGIAPNPDKRLKGAERIICNADSTSVVLTVYNSQRAARVDITKPGRQLFNPLQARRNKK